MAWTESSLPAFGVVVPGWPGLFCVQVNANSTSMILDPEGVGASTLRLFNLHADNIFWGDGTCGPMTRGDVEWLYTIDPRSYPCSTESDIPFEPKDAFYGYIDSEAVSGQQTFVIRPDRDPMRAGASVLGATCLRRYRVLENYRYIQRDFGAHLVYGSLVTAPYIGFFYSSLGVTRLPDGRWIAVLSRMRVWLDAADVVEPDSRIVERILEENGHDRAVGDIVAFVASDAAFTVDVIGPMWLVDSKEALPPDELPVAVAGPSEAPARLWLSVPTVAVLDDAIYVYYVFRRSSYFADAAVGPADGGDYGETEYVRLVNQGDLDPGIAGKRFDWNDLRLAIKAQEMKIAPEERDWEAEQFLGTSDPVVPGELLGRVRVWMDPEPGGGYSYRAPQRFESVFAAANYAASHGLQGQLQFIDPVAVTCQGSGVVSYTDTLSLFFVANVATAPLATDIPLAYGVWRAAPMREPLPDPSTSAFAVLPPVFGKDFFVRIDWSTMTSPDFIVGVDETVGTTAGNAVAQYLNPDVVQQADGSWRVQTSGGDTPVQNRVWLGSPIDVCGVATADVPSGPWNGPWNRPWPGG